MELENLPSTIKMTIEKAKKEDAYTGYFEVEGVKKYIWSKYYPEKEGKDFIKFDQSNKETVWILFGMALGYSARAIRDKAGEYARIIVVEPNEQLIKVQKEYIGDLLKDKRIQIIYEKDKEKIEKIITSVIKVVDLKNIKLIIHPLYRQLFKGHYEEILEMVQTSVDKMQVNYNTITQFSEINLENIMNNVKYVKESKNIESYRNYYKDIPAVIVSAGPSLNKNIEQLKNFKGLVFTGGRSLPHVMKQGVTPDFLVSIDPTEISYETLQEGKQNECNLICTEVTNHLIVSHNKGNKYFVRGTQGNLVKKLIDVNFTGLPMYGSVATLCLSSAHFMGCNPIVFIGQDLAYTNLKAHVDEFKSYEVDEKNPDIRYVEGIDGQMVATDLSLMLFLNWIEKFIDSTKGNTEYINCTEGGANIKGTRIMDFKEAIRVYSDDYKVDYKVENLYDEVTKEKIEQNLANTIHSLNQVKSLAQRGIQLSERLKKECHLYGAKRQSEINEILVELDQNVDSKLKKSNQLAVEIFTREYTKAASELKYKTPFEETEKQRYSRITEMSYNLYKNIYDATECTLQIILKNIKEKN